MLYNDHLSLWVAAVADAVQVSPKKPGKANNELCLVAGENELVKAVRKHGCFCTSEVRALAISGYTS